MLLEPEVGAAGSLIGVPGIPPSVTFCLHCLHFGCVLPYVDALLWIPFGCVSRNFAPSGKGAPSVEGFGGFEGGDVAPFWLVAFFSL